MVVIIMPFEELPSRSMAFAGRCYPLTSKVLLHEALRVTEHCSLAYLNPKTHIVCCLWASGCPGQELESYRGLAVGFISDMACPKLVVLIIR